MDSLGGSGLSFIFGPHVCVGLVSDPAVSGC
jgi:hypothetical protein